MVWQGLWEFLVWLFNAIISIFIRVADMLGLKDFLYKWGIFIVIALMCFVIGRYLFDKIKG